MSRRVVILGACLVLTISAFGQKTIRGFVIDSASFVPLPYVSVQVKNTYRGVSTDAKGGFAIPTIKGDTIIFSLIGYNQEMFSAAELDETVIIRLAEHVKQLDVVTIVGHKEKTVPAFHIKPSKGNVPSYGSQGMAVNFAYFTKEEKEKRKLARVQAEQARVHSYVMVVCSPDVKERICKEFDLNDDQYFQLLAEFNIANENVRQEYSSEEWITVLRSFYRDNANRR